jgi:asparagine synthase (glutamine-hydrolysing)
MSTLAGWLDTPIGELPADMILRRMVGTTAFGRGSVRTLPAAAEAVARLAPGIHGDLTASDSFLGAIVGRPRWTMPELATLAAREGHAKALVQAYRVHGMTLFRCLRGSFAIAVIDRLARRLLLAVDRLGIETMCWSEPKSGGVAFGSTTDVVRAHPAVVSTVSEQAVFDYLYFGISPSPGTIYREHRKLLPAQYLLYEQGRTQNGFYWEMPYREVSAKSLPDLTHDLMKNLRGAVARATEAQDPGRLGAFLSGGLDSSTVAGLLSETTHRRAKTFTIGFSHDRYDEVHYAKIAARHFGIEHYIYYLTPKDVVAALPTVARAFDEPYGNSSVVPAYYCAKLASEHGVELMLAGDGGDEIFAGNSRYVDQQILGLYSKVPPALRSYFIEPLVMNVPGLDGWNIGGKVRRYIRRARLAMPERLETDNFYRSAVLSEIFTAEALSAIDPDDPLANMREAYDRTQSGSMLQRMLHLDLKITLADNDLRKVTGACDMAGMQVAYPFLDDDLVEFSAQVPPSLLIRGMSRRWFFKHAIRDFLPKQTLAKRKHGFGIPYMEWPKENRELREIAVDCAESLKRRAYLRPDFLHSVIEDKSGIYDALVWDIMMLELWFRERAAATHSASLDGIVT